MKFAPDRWEYAVRNARVIVIGLLACTSAACVSNELDAVDRTGAAYQACEMEKTASDPECEALRRDHVDAQRRYEENARRAWGCGLNEADCPTPR